MRRRLRRTGSSPTRGIERSAVQGLAFLLFIHCLARTRAAPPSAVDSATGSSRLGGASPLSFGDIGSGRTLELGRSRRSIMRRRLRRTGSSPTRGIERSAVQGVSRSSSLSIASRARGPRRPERGRQRDRLEPAGRRFAAFFLVIFGSGRTLELGRSRRSIMRRRLRRTGSSPTRGIERSAR